MWTVDEQLRDYICRNGFNQNIDADFSNSKREYFVVPKGNNRTFNRYLSKQWFKTVLINCETCPRAYLSYSLSKGSIFCVPCYLFGNQTFLSKNGFSNWKHPEKLKKHENSKDHRTCVYKMKQRSLELGKIDDFLGHQLEIEISYWKNVLLRVCSTVKALASHGLPFRGAEEKFGSSSCGNFIMAMELIAEYDPFLSQHISLYGNPGKGNTSYMSFHTYEQFINLMSEKVIEQIVVEIKTAVYFSISIDSSPDITHLDQLSFVVRYIMPNGEPIERFMGFIKDAGHKAKSLTEAILSILKKHNLSILFLRGQSYDNANNMTGIYSGVQARIKAINPLADFVPCSAHSLNLIGTCAASCCNEANIFSTFLQHLYVYFSSSTHRWNVLKKFCDSNLKILSETRWSARDDACLSLKKNWVNVKKALIELQKDETQKAVTRVESKGLLRQLGRRETAFMVIFWSDVLHTFNKTSKLLQSVQIDLSTVVELYNSLSLYVESVHSMFQIYEEATKKIFEDKDNIPEYETKKRKRKKQFDESNEPDYTFDGLEDFKINTFYIICGNLIVELNKRKSAYNTIVSKT